MVRASASTAKVSGLIQSRVKPMTSKLVFTVSLFDAQHQRESVENKPASLLNVLQGKALNRFISSWGGRQVAGNS